jgi:DNA-binding NtrC family response regulator
MSKSMYPALPVLIVDDEAQILSGFAMLLRLSGINNLFTCQDAREVMSLLSSQEAEAILLDLRMPHVYGEDLLSSIVTRHPGIPVVMITGIDDVETAVRCMKTGAFDYLTKPVEEARLVTTVRRAIAFRDLHREIRALRYHILTDRLEHPEAFSELITQNKSMISIMRYIESIAATSQPVLIEGETGTGKEIIAKAIHLLSKLKGPFIRINVAGLDDNVFSDTLFGHARGAFTGADTPRPGLVERASGGTLFLDEIGDLSIPSQLKLLGLLQEREYLPLGRDEPKYTDARVIVATNRDLRDLQAKGLFRKDLFYRLDTHHISVPPLRERRDDLPILVDHFLKEAALTLGKKKPTAPRELFDLLAAYHFPGNVRELKAMIFDAVSQHKSHVLSMQAFKIRIAGEAPVRTQIQEAAGREGSSVYSTLSKLPTLKDASDLLIAEALQRSRGNISAAAGVLGISHQALSKRLKRRSEA